MPNEQVIPFVTMSCAESSSLNMVEVLHLGLLHMSVPKQLKENMNTDLY
jgi:hypothetical protein